MPTNTQSATTAAFAPAFDEAVLAEAQRTAERQARLAARGGGTLERRRSSWLARLAPHLGPTQWRHLTDHGDAVAALAVRLAGAVGLAPGDVGVLRRASTLHDIGKAAVPEALLAHPGPLTPAQRAVVDRHAAIGATLACALGEPAEVCAAIAAHHDRFDARSRTVPESPAAAPAVVGVIAVADALATMLDGRPYAPARDVVDALGELRRGRGGQFDPAVVAAAHRVVGVRLTRAA